MCNVGHTDQIIRFVVGVLLLAVGPFIGSVIGFVMVGAGVIAILTSVFNICPLYMIFKMSTAKE
ncbi:MAG: DUF2892 domain-containing protein [Thiovulaceae bacterium]|nr:DUF2892 domain-containing protein [Sulfurimonadaceae bacterium]